MEKCQYALAYALAHIAVKRTPGRVRYDLKYSASVAYVDLSIGAAWELGPCGGERDSSDSAEISAAGIATHSYVYSIWLPAIYARYGTMSSIQKLSITTL